MVAMGLLTAFGTQAETVWTHGVTQDSGWYDANKTHADDGVEDWMGNITYPNDPTGNGAKTDDNMCYAASAANLLAWWQARYEKVEGVPQGVEEIWKKFVESSTQNSGSNVPAAVTWWLNGTDSKYILTQHEGYYTLFTNGESVYNTQTNDKFIGKIAEPTGQALISALNEGKGVSLLASGHAITLWGLEHTDGIISKMWITDSDDYTGTAELLELTVGGTDGAYTLELGAKTYTIDAAYTIDPTVSDGWGMQRVSENTIPEPTTTMLGMLALATLAARRRRK